MPSKYKLYQDTWRKNNHEKLNQVAITYRFNNKGTIKVTNKKHTFKLKLEILNYYSQNKLECQCCSTKELEFLTIDHINGGGAQHRRTMKAGSLYHWLKRNNFPEGFRVLCMNCNWSYGKWGYCPHECGSLMEDGWLSV